MDALDRSTIFKLMTQSIVNIAMNGKRAFAKIQIVTFVKQDRIFLWLYPKRLNNQCTLH